MRCRWCGSPAGWWRRRCASCLRLWQVWEEHRGAPPAEILDALLATGADREAVARFLDAPLAGGGTVRDQIAADVSNALFGALGLRARQTAAEVARLRARGWWRAYDRRPEWKLDEESDGER